MPKIRHRKLSNAVWIPLRAIHQIEEVGRYGDTGYKSEFYGVGTIAVPTDSKLEAEELGFFLIDAEGTKENSEKLIEGGRWLSFRPEVIAALVHRRGAHLDGTYKIPEE